MKKIMILILLCFCGLWSSAQSLVEDFSNKHGEEVPFTVVNVSAKMFSLITDAADLKTKSIIKNLTGFRLLRTTMLTDNFYRVALSMVEKSKNGFEELISVRDGKENVRIYIREVKGVVKELVVVVKNVNEFVIMGFTGNIDLKKISQLSKSMNISGMEYLNKIDTQTTFK